MNQTDYVSYDLAIALEKAGFNEECSHVYCKWSLEDIDIQFLKEEERDGQYICAKAPTLWQAQKWLREEKNWHIIIKPLLWGDLTYEFKLWNKFSGDSNAIGFDFSSYEKALSKAIETVLKLIE